MRESLKGYSNDELRDGFTSRQSAMSKLYSEQPKQLYGGYRDAAAHVLLERGILSSRGCMVGSLSIEK